MAVDGEKPDGIDGELLERYCRAITCLDTLEVDELTPDRVTARARLTEAGLNGAGFAHGGWLFSLADVCSGLPALAGGNASVTQDASISYLNPAMAGTEVDIDVEVLRRGRRSVVSQVRLTNGGAASDAAGTGELLATGLFTHVMLGKLEEMA